MQPSKCSNFSKCRGCSSPCMQLQPCLMLSRPPKCSICRTCRGCSSPCMQLQPCLKLSRLSAPCSMIAQRAALLWLLAPCQPLALHQSPAAHRLPDLQKPLAAPRLPAPSPPPPSQRHLGSAASHSRGPKVCKGVSVDTSIN